MNRQRNRLANAVMRQPGVGRQYAMSQPHKGLIRRVRVDCAQAAQMSGVEGLQQIKRFGAAYLSDKNPIRPMSQRGSDQFRNRHRWQRQLLPKWKLCSTCFEAKE